MQRRGSLDMEQKGSLLSRMAALFATDAGTYLASLFLPGVLGIGLYLAMLFWLTSPGSQGTPGDPLSIWRSLSVFEKLGAFTGMLLTVWLPVFLAARGICKIAASRLLGQEIDFAAVLRDGVRFLPTAFVYSFIIGFPSAMAFAFLVIPSILVLALFTLVIPAGIVEGTTLFAALRRGTQLAGREYGRSFLLVLASAASVALLLFFRQKIFPYDGSTDASATLLRVIMIYVPTLLLMLLSNICFTLLYFDATSAAPAQPPVIAAAGGS